MSYQKNTYCRIVAGCVTAFSLLLMNGCTTSWRAQGSFNRTVQTELAVKSVPAASVYVNDKYAGQTPLQVPVQYEQEVERRTRKVSYWENQPGWSFLISLLSLGVYVPFGFIPIVEETTLQPKDSFSGNTIVVKVAADGYEPWAKQVVCKGENSIPLETSLQQTQR